ncbi:extracellular serine-rich protein [Rhypophila decipiens]|uniref:Extracellular serine-rich protein n=1 Tax=Rhypophila decipiens TaxID=261697 RepID=A0AAN6XY93_9PEZI|nr:extracellular serine-rich protein [Rhypophila decipiens]
MITTKVTTMKVITLLSLLSSASAATIKIDVGKSGLTFSPDSVTAKTGDILEYHFQGPVPHSVAQSDFSSPCNPSKTGGFYSGMIGTAGNGEDSDVFRVTVNSTSPIFFYCGVPGHCEGGMAGVVNPSSSGSETLEAYKNAAQSANTVAPANVFGGVLGPADDSSSTTTVSETGTGTGTSSSTMSPTGGNSASGGAGGGSYGGNGNSGSAALGASVFAVS